MNAFFITFLSAFIVSSCTANSKSKEELTEEFQKLDKNNDGFIEPKDLYDIYDSPDLIFQDFYFFDSNKDGKLSMEEYIIMNSREGDINSFKKIDKDEDGFITLEELREVYLAGDEFEADYATTELMSLFDKNHDGYLDLEEFKNVAKHELGDEDFQEIDSVFKSVDKDGDGKVSRQELREAILHNLREDSLQLVKQDFMYADKDQDGKLSIDEYLKNLCE